MLRALQKDRDLSQGLRPPRHGPMQRAPGRCSVAPSGSPDVLPWGGRTTAVANPEDGRRMGSRREGQTLKRLPLRPLLKPLSAQCLPPDLLGLGAGVCKSPLHLDSKMSRSESGQDLGLQSEAGIFLSSLKTASILTLCSSGGQSPGQERDRGHSPQSPLSLLRKVSGSVV